MSETTTRHQRPKHIRADSYDNIEPWFEKMAALAQRDPHRNAVREQILELCLPLAEHIARRFSGRGEEFDDLVQVARLGLVQAVDRFEISRGSTFLSFAVPTIMGEVRRHFRDHTWAVRVPRRLQETQRRIGPATERLCHRLGRMPAAREIAAELDVDLCEVTQALIARNGYRADSIDRLAPAGGQDDPPSALDTLGAEEPCYRLTEDAMTVRPLIAKLPENERRVLIMRYFESQTQSQIAARLNVSQMQVSRILSRILDTLRTEALGENRLARTA